MSTPVDLGDPCEVPGNVCTWLGFPGLGGISGEGLPRTSDNDHWDAGETLLYSPVDITFGPDGTAWYPDYRAHRIRRVASDGTVDTVSGTTQLGDGPRNADGSSSDCWSGCDALLSAWTYPSDVAVDPAAPNELIVAAWDNGRVNHIDPGANAMTWLACAGGSGNYGASDLDGDGDLLDDCLLDLPSSVAVAEDGAIYVSDQANQVVRRIDREAGTITVVAGEPRRAGMDGDGGPAVDAHLHGHCDPREGHGSKLALSGQTLHLADSDNGVIRAIDLTTGIITTVAGRYQSAGTGGIADCAAGDVYVADPGSVPGYSGDGGPALEAILNSPVDVAFGADGEMYVADTGNNCVRVVRDGIIDRFAGQCGEPEVVVGELFDGVSDRELRDAALGNGGPALDASFGNVYGVAVDAEGNVHIADTDNHVIRRVKR